MFEQQTATATKTRGLPGTAQLTGFANQLANEMIRKIGADEDNYREKFVASQTDNGVMDRLVKELVDINALNSAFLQETDVDILEKMLKSQQSKRSRLKSLPMTFDNYRGLASGAIAELVLRDILGKPKATVNGRRPAGVLDYTDEEIERYKTDQEALRRELRNVQSKKSIAKSKTDFSEDNERWQKLLDAEALLKSLRLPIHRVVDKTGEQLKAELDGRDINDLKAAEARDLLKKLLEQAGGEA